MYEKERGWTGEMATMLCVFHVLGSWRVTHDVARLSVFTDLLGEGEFHAGFAMACDGLV